MVQMIIEGENILLIGGLTAVAILGLWFGHILRRWSWVPRKRQRKAFGERW